ncbi:hypothetical protein F5X98DRAFT_386676 [Xylaria grammica]|nr:hypothetical protein F5X98DRAFT_386676 [Xylaria grammica]
MSTSSVSIPPLRSTPKSRLAALQFGAFNSVDVTPNSPIVEKNPACWDDVPPTFTTPVSSDSKLSRRISTINIPPSTQLDCDVPSTPVVERRPSGVDRGVGFGVKGGSRFLPDTESQGRGDEDDEEIVPPSQIILDDDIIEVDPAYCNGAENDNAKIKIPPTVKILDRDGDDSRPAKRPKADHDNDDNGLSSLNEVGVGESAEDVVPSTTTARSSSRFSITGEGGYGYEEEHQTTAWRGQRLDIRIRNQSVVEGLRITGDTRQLPPMPAVKIEGVGEAPNATSRGDELVVDCSMGTTVEEAGSQVEKGLPEILKDAKTVEESAAVKKDLWETGAYEITNFGVYPAKRHLDQGQC